MLSFCSNLPGQIEPVQDKNDYLLTGVIGLCDVYHICRHIHSCINHVTTNITSMTYTYASFKYKLCFCVALAVGTPFYVLCVAIARLVHGNNWISKILMLNEDLKEAYVYVMLVIFVVTWLIQ
jgi:hypothetical protein